MNIASRPSLQRTLRAVLLAVVVESPTLWATDGPCEKAQRECSRLREEGQYFAAESFCRQALIEAERFGTLDSRLVSSQSDLGTLNLRLSRLSEAELFLQQSLETGLKQANSDGAELAADQTQR